jgi:hypothetical protein
MWGEAAAAAVSAAAAPQSASSDRWPAGLIRGPLLATRCSKFMLYYGSAEPRQLYCKRKLKTSKQGHSRLPK